jgi:putative transposase
MILIEKHIIDNNNPFFKEIDNLCFLGKNLYNRANFIVRQTFIETSKLKEEGKCDHAIYFGYYDLKKILKSDENYKSLPAKVSSLVLMKLDKNWKSFFKSIKDWKKNPHKYTGKPSLPNYKNKLNGRVMLEYELGAISKPYLKKHKQVKLSKTNLIIPFINNTNKLNQVRIVPINKIEYKIEIVYEKQENYEVDFPDNSYVGVDLGVNNLITITSNKKGVRPVLINGRPIKSINQFYNKTKSKLMSELPNKSKVELDEYKLNYGKEGSKQVKHSKKINQLTNKRNGKIEKYFHQTSNYLIDFCLNNEIKTICVGKNKFWKQGVNNGKKNNQSFVSIPFSKLIDQILYKAKLNGLIVILTEESYTSKASFMNMDEIPIYGGENDENLYNFSGYRQHRGLYKIKGEKTTINADVNGSFNIIRKVVPNAFVDGIEGIPVCPIKVTFDK